MVCNNCEFEFTGNYCPNCGQKSNKGRITFRESAKDVLEHYFDYDAPLFRTITGLIAHPGSLIREYIHGKRKKYSHPIRFFLLMLAVYMLIKELLDFDPIKTFAEATGMERPQTPNASYNRASNFFSEHINLFLPLYAFLLAAFTRLFYRKSGFNFIENLSMGFFLVGEYLFISVFITILSTFWPMFFLLNYLFVIIFPVYVIITFYPEKWTWSIPKAIFSSLLGWILYAISGQIISVYIVRFFEL